MNHFLDYQHASAMQSLTTCAPRARNLDAELLSSFVQPARYAEVLTGWAQAHDWTFFECETAFNSLHRQDLITRQSDGWTLTAAGKTRMGRPP